MGAKQTRSPYRPATESSTAYCVGMFMLMLHDLGHSKESVITMLTPNTISQAYDIATRSVRA